MCYMCLIQFAKCRIIKNYRHNNYHLEYSIISAFLDHPKNGVSYTYITWFIFIGVPSYFYYGRTTFPHQLYSFYVRSRFLYASSGAVCRKHFGALMLHHVARVWFRSRMRPPVNLRIFEYCSERKVAHVALIHGFAPVRVRRCSSRTLLRPNDMSHSYGLFLTCFLR